ncbi:MAG: MipA/OmpV family protein [Methyloligellaceae bacterium]
MDIFSKNLNRIARLCGIAVLLAGLWVPAVAKAEGVADGSFVSKLAVGGAVLVKPKYEGSDEFDVYGIPYAVVLGNGLRRFSFEGIDDVRYALYRNNGFEVGPTIGYWFDREESDSATLNGLGDIDGAFVAGGYAKYDFGGFFADVSFHHGFNGDDPGYLIKTGIGSKSRISERVKLKARAGITFASEDYMDTYFGVTAAQSAASGVLPAFNPDSGIKDVHVSLGATIGLTDRWYLVASGEYSRLVGDAEDSPVVESEDQFTGLIGLTYRLGGHGAPEPLK